jgi:hypothetical protein
MEPTLMQYLAQQAGIAGAAVAEQVQSEVVSSQSANPAEVEAIVQRLSASDTEKREMYNEIYAPFMGTTVPTVAPFLEAAVPGVGVGAGLGDVLAGGNGTIPETEVLTGSLAALAGGAVSGWVGGTLGTILGGLAGWGIGQLVGGEDVSAMNVLEQYTGGGAMANGSTGVTVTGGTYVNGVPFGGPGVPEPPANLVSRAWKTKAFSKTAGEYWVYFWRLIDGRILCWNAAKRTAKIWRPKKPIVMYRGKITLSQAVKTQRILDRLWRTVAKKTKALKLA